MQTLDELKIEFRSNLNEIVSSLIERFDLKFVKDESSLSDPLFRWLDFLSRYIEPKPREVLLSNAYPFENIECYRSALETLSKKFEKGEDINVYQSKGLYNNSPNSAKSFQRTDLLYADWGIHHLHILDDDAPDSARSDWLLFCIIADKHVGFLDIRNHKDENIFSDTDMIETLFESWPELMEPFKLNSVLPSKETFTAQDKSKLRKSGMNSFIEYNGSVYCPPNMGISSASTAMNVTHSASFVAYYIAVLADIVFEEKEQFKKYAKDKGIENPVFRFRLHKNKLGILEEGTGVFHVLPREHIKDNNLAKLYQLMIPEWLFLKLA